MEALVAVLALVQERELVLVAVRVRELVLEVVQVEELVQVLVQELVLRLLPFWLASTLLPFAASWPFAPAFSYGPLLCMFASFSRVARPVWLLLA